MSGLLSSLNSRGECSTCGLDKLLCICFQLLLYRNQQRLPIQNQAQATIWFSSMIKAILGITK